MYNDISAFLAAYPLSNIAFLLAAALTAGIARGFSGFGGALIFIPLATSVIDPKIAVAMLFLVDAVLALPMAPHALRHADRREVSTMLAGAVIGVPVGTAILSFADPLTVRWAVTGLVAMLLTLLASGWRYSGQPSAPLTVATGVVSGVFGGAAQVGGPPVVAYWLGGHNSPLLVRANIVFYFALSTAVTGINYLFAGLLNGTAALLALIVGPAFGLGLAIGSRLFGRVAEPLFRKICLCLIGAAALFGMPLMDGVLR